MFSQVLKSAGKKPGALPSPGRIALLLAVLALGILMIQLRNRSRVEAAPVPRPAETGGPYEVTEVLQLAEWNVKSGKPDQAVALLNEALRRRPDDKGLLLMLAKAREQRGDFDGAAASYGRALEAHPRCPECLNGRGLHWLKRGFPRRAVRDLSGAVAQDPAYAEAYFNLGVAYEKNDEIRKAILAYRKYLELIPLNDSRSGPSLARERIHRLKELL